MKREITFTSAPYRDFMSDLSGPWVGGGEKQMLYIDAIVGFSAAEDGPNGMKRTIIHLSNGHEWVGVGTVGEFKQKVIDAESDHNNRSDS